MTSIPTESSNSKIQMLNKIKEMIESLDSLSKTKPIKIISHNDTDGITSAAIFSKALERWNKPFSLEIIKNLETDYIKSLPENHILIFLDLASGSLKELAKKQTEIFILDHHEMNDNEIPRNIKMVNPHIFQEENVAASALCYLFALSLSEQNKDLATLAVIGMIGDMLEKNIGKTYEKILKDAEVSVKKGLLLYPATRPIDRVLENSHSINIPEVSGSFKGVLELLRDSNIEKSSKGFPSISELSDEQMTNLGTAIMLRNPEGLESKDIFGNIYLIKFFNTLEDAREISASINACARMDHPEISLGLCLKNTQCKKESERIYIKYKKTISSTLKKLPELQKISGKNYTIINAQDKIKDTLVGTVASIMSFSPLYPEGTVIITMAYTSPTPQSTPKIKVSGRIAGRKGRNILEILHKAASPISAEVGGHQNAAGCLIPIEKEAQFLNNLKQTLEAQLIKV